jgi:hypothetical protein
VGAAPPGERAFGEALSPRKKQKQAEDDLDIHRHHEKRVDVEIHTGAVPLFRGSKIPVASETSVKGCDPQRRMQTYG